MKKLSLVLLCVFVLSCATVQAKTGDVVGHIYSTDIVAYIDDMPIPSYNIGGETVVSENYLPEYGFNVKWEADDRELKINFGDKPEKAPAYTVTKGKPGKTLGNVYATDIRAYVRNIHINSYNIGGETMGPGFDCFGIALNLYNVVSACETESGLEILSPEFKVCRNEERNHQNLVYRAMREVFNKAEYEPTGLKIVHARGCQREWRRPVYHYCG